MSESNDSAASKCFVCSFTAENPKVIFNHCAEKHGFDIKKALSAKDCIPDQLDYVKAVNFMRKHKVASLNSNEWKADQYLMPSMAQDPLLYFDIEELFEAEKGSDEAEPLEKKLERVQAELAEARTTIDEMKGHVHKWLGEPYRPRSVGDATPSEDSDEDNDRMAENGKAGTLAEEPYLSEESRELAPSKGDSLREKIAPVDSSYFFSYAGYSVHKDMLQDVPRTEAYLNFVKNNKSLFENKVVIDVGCGTGILSMFAIRYGGARKVFALEPSSIALQAIDTIAENGIADDPITVINAPAESSLVDEVLTDFGEKVDIVISEWMGYFLLFENMLPSVIYARDRFMKPSGVMAPSSANLFIDATDSEVCWRDFVGFWSDVYGFTMRKMRARILMDAQLWHFDKSDIVSKEPTTIFSLMLNNCPIPPAHFEKKFEMEFTKTTKITAFVGWFTVGFEGGSNNVLLTTAPGEPKTHWQQTALLLPEPLAVEANKSYSCTVTVSRCPNDHRSLTISVKFETRNFTWALCRD